MELWKLRKTGEFKFFVVSVAISLGIMILLVTGALELFPTKFVTLAYLLGFFVWVGSIRWDYLFFLKRARKEPGLCPGCGQEGYVMYYRCSGCGHGEEPPTRPNMTLEELESRQPLLDAIKRLRGG